MLITPPQAHIHLEVLFRAGKLLIRTVGEPTIQGAGVTGTQGPGVKNTGGGRRLDGLAGELHTPKGGMLAIGAKSIIVAAIGPPAITGSPLGIAMRDEGATPKVHCINAPVTTCCAIY